MSDEELEGWLLDTVAEGGYSFKEISEYVEGHEVKGTRLSGALLSLTEKGLIKVAIRYGDNEYMYPSIDESRSIFQNFALIIARESKSVSMHYLQVTS